MDNVKKAELIGNGVLISFTSGRWQARAKISVNQLGEEIPAEIVSASKSLVDDRTILKDFAMIIRSAKVFINQNSVPFPVEGVRWIPKDRITKVDKYLTKKQEEYFAERSELAGKIDAVRRRYAKKYPEFYDPSRYPTPEQIIAKFRFQWQFFQMDVPAKGKLLDVNIFKREQEKFERMIGEMGEMTMNIFGNSIIKRLEKLNSQCTDGKANAGTINAINRLMKQWEELWEDHVDEQRFKKAIARIKRQISNLDAEAIRNNEDLQDKVASVTEKIVNQIKRVPNFELKRKVDL
jgi:hypothetical protein